MRSFFSPFMFSAYFYHLMTSLQVLAVHPLNVNILRFLNIYCKDKILLECRLKELVKFII